MSTDTRLKYRIKEAFIRKHGTEEAVRKAKSELCIRHNIPAGTLNRDINLRMVESGEVSEIRLQCYANFLAVTVAFLKEDYVNSVRAQIL